MASPASPADTRAFIIERLVGDRGDNANVVEAGRALGARALPLFSDGLNASLSSPVTIELKSVDVSRLSEVKPQDTTRFAMTIGASPMSSDALVMLIDADAIAVVVSALFGGDPDLPITPIARELSPTELEVAGIVFQEVATSVNGWGARALNVKFPLPTALTGTELKRKIFRDGPAVRLVFSIAIGETIGTLQLHMPQRVLMHRTGGKATEAEPAVAEDWRQRFNDEVMRSKVELEATMPLQRITLGELANLQAGQVIELEPNAQSEARLSARKKTLFVCEFGKLGQHYTVRVKSPFDEDKDFMDGLLPGQG
jgi:flagellar motor switch protein FliM